MMDDVRQEKFPEKCDEYWIEFLKSGERKVRKNIRKKIYARISQDKEECACIFLNILEQEEALEKKKRQRVLDLELESAALHIAPFYRPFIWHMRDEKEKKLLKIILSNFFLEYLVPVRYHKIVIISIIVIAVLCWCIIFYRFT